MSNYNTAETLNYVIELQKYLFGDDIPIRYRNSIMSFDTFLYNKFIPFCGRLEEEVNNNDDLLELSYIDPTIQDFIYKARESIKNKVENMTPLVNNPDFWKHIKEYYLKRFFRSKIYE